MNLLELLVNRLYNDCKKHFNNKGKRMSEFIKPVDRRIESYISQLLEKYNDNVLAEMEKFAEQEKFPVVGRAVGSMLQVLARSVNAKRIFEFGSGFGYSAYWFTNTLAEGGKVICCDHLEQNVKRAKKYLSEAGKWEKVEYHFGLPLEVFAGTSGDFDIIYNDGEKQEYPEVWQAVKDRIRPGGLYICDNVLWAGRVLDTEMSESCTSAIRESTSMIMNDSNYDFFINAIHDGVLIAQRK
ncbi:O-methyltransferase [Candidatus Uabimicrobium sp. HlEnr_7]|uniref:O-methyltransferase n=1 Tax=Candidatus Uabimicrobium helgolandensis TaxID=3095367 RepID=UPI003558AD04